MKSLTVLLVVLTLPCSGWTNDESIEKYAEKLVPTTAEAREVAAKAVISERDKKIAGLITVLAASRKADKLSKEEREREAFAIRLLGDLRAEEAVAPLLDRVDRSYLGNFITLGSKEDVVLAALKKIGKPASVAAIAYIAKETSKEKTRRYVAVISDIEGVEIAKEMLRIAAQKEKDPERKKRLNASFEFFR